MISERKFSKSYSSFWNQLLPNSDSFIRKLNLTLERYCMPLKSNLPIDRDKRAIINELSFRLFKEKTLGVSLTDKQIKKISEETKKYIMIISRNNVDSLKKIEINESMELSNSINLFFKKKDYQSIIFWPKFKGCGFIQSCQGDIIVENKLIEIKAGDRYFRIIDIRQIITYLTLNFFSKEYELSQVALVNPRTGLKYEIFINDLIEACSGKKPVDIFSEVNEFITLVSVSSI